MRPTLHPPRAARHRSFPLIAILASTVAACAGAGSPVPSPGSAPTPTPGTTPAVTPAVTQAASPTPATAADLAALLDAARSEYGAPGALAVMRRGEERMWAASGFADLDGTPISDTTRFRIASITKTIVAALVLDAVDRGQVSLDTVVGDLLPGALQADPPVTVRQLLDHTSGIADATNDFTSLDQLQAAIEEIADPALRDEALLTLGRYAGGERVIASDRVIVALSETLDRYFEPGTSYHYSNTNYVLAAMILEKVTGQPLAALLRARVAEPLALQRTTITPPDLRSPELRGYGTSTADGSLVDLTDDLVFFGNGGEGGVIATADELLATMQAIVGGRLLPEALTAAMKEPSRESGGSYGLGLATYSLSCGTFFGHEGGVDGTASIALVSPDGADGVVVALNLRSGEDPRLPALADAILCGGP
jgi:D-alanyl-D-alanine carboxypeptidase